MLSDGCRSLVVGIILGRSWQPRFFIQLSGYTEDSDVENSQTEACNYWETPHCSQWLTTFYQSSIKKSEQFHSIGSPYLQPITPLFLCRKSNTAILYR